MNKTITWHGHANFQIATPECNILIDPFFSGNPKAVTAWEAIDAPDAVLVTHMHGDHAGDAASICKKFGSLLGAVVGTAEKFLPLGVPEKQILNGIGFNIGGTVSVKGVSITMTQAFHTSEAGAPTGYILTFADGYTIYHAGDTGIFASMGLFGELYSIDLALLPVGGVFTMDARQGAMAAKLLKARSVIPMHWGTFPVLSQSTDDFKKELAAKAPGCRCLDVSPGQSVELQRLE